MLWQKDQHHMTAWNGGKQKGKVGMGEALQTKDGKEQVLVRKRKSKGSDDGIELLSWRQ